MKLIAKINQSIAGFSTRVKKAALYIALHFKVMGRQMLWGIIFCIVMVWIFCAVIYWRTPASSNEDNQHIFAPPEIALSVDGKKSLIKEKGIQAVSAASSLRAETMQRPASLVMVQHLQSVCRRKGGRFDRYRQIFKTGLSAEKPISLILVHDSLNDQGLQGLLKALPSFVTVALSPFLENARSFAQQFHKKGHEVLLLQSFQPFGYPFNAPQKGALLTQMTAAEMERALTFGIEKIPCALGCVAFGGGGKFMADAQALSCFFKTLCAQQLFFVDRQQTVVNYTEHAKKESGTDVLRVQKEVRTLNDLQRALHSLKRQPQQRQKPPPVLLLSTSCLSKQMTLFQVVQALKRYKIRLVPLSAVLEWNNFSRVQHVTPQLRRSQVRPKTPAVLPNQAFVVVESVKGVHNK